MHGPQRISSFSTLAVVEQFELRAIFRFEVELGGHVGTVNVGQLLAIPVDDIKEAIRGTAHGPPRSPPLYGVVARFVQRCAVLVGRAIADVGVLQKGATPLAGSKRKMSAFIGRSLDAEFDSMSETDGRALFATYDQEKGGLPLAHEELSGDQIQILREVLRADRPPAAQTSRSEGHVVIGWREAWWRKATRRVLYAASDAGRHRPNREHTMCRKRRWGDSVQRHSDLESEQPSQVTRCDREVWGRPEGTFVNEARRTTEPPWKTCDARAGRLMESTAPDTARTQPAMRSSCWTSQIVRICRFACMSRSATDATNAHTPSYHKDHHAWTRRGNHRVEVDGCRISRELWAEGAPTLSSKQS